MKTILTNSIALILLTCIFFGPKTASGQITDSTFSFTLTSDANTSAGVYNKDSTLVRTLWSGVSYSAGQHVAKWDGLLDDGTPAPADAYQIRVLSGNVTYQWEGAIIGNTSDALTGSTKLHSLDVLHGMAVSNNNIYWAAGYAERWPSDYRTSITDPDSKTWIGPLQETDQSSSFVCADNQLIYWAGQDPIDPNNETFVFATKATDDSRAVFANGVPASMDWGSVYQSVISYMYTPKSVASLITGIAVQKTSNYLFVSRQGLNQLQVLDKTSGALVQTITITAPSVMQVDNNNNLWLVHGSVIEKYIVNADGSLTSSNIVINISNIGAVAVSPDNATVIIADITAGQVKGYSNSTGSFLWALGQTQSYINNAAVADDKFYWSDVRQSYTTFLCYLPDGTFYVGDQQNHRVQHFNASQQFIDRTMYLPAIYSAMVDPNDPTRVFADFLEFKIDYTKPLAKDNGSWTLVNNWGANVSTDYDLFEKMRFVATLSNGHTYARLRKNDYTYTLVELAANAAVRFTGIVLPSLCFIGKDGSKIVSSPPAVGQSQIISKYRNTGFTSDNNPYWFNTPELIATTPPVTANDPVAWEGFRAEPFTDLNETVFFDYTKAQDGHSSGFHLGLIKNDDTKWAWRTATSTSVNYSGPFPGDGAFDNGNTVVYPGGAAFVCDKNIFWGYHGEFWKQSQTNKWNHVYDNGLLVGQFGELSMDHPNEEAYSGGAGNAFAGNAVTVNGATYLYQNDESVHGGIHRWKINGLNTIQVQTAVYPSTIAAPSPEGVDLLGGLVRNISLQNNALGWHRTITTDYTAADGEYFKATTGEKSYDIFESPDLFLRFNQASGTADVTRDLGTNFQLSTWKLSGKVNFLENTPNHPYAYGGSYVEVLDYNNRVIAQFYMSQYVLPNSNIIGPGTDVIGNKQIIYHSTGLDLQIANSKDQPIEISCDHGMISFTYANYTTLTTPLLLDSTADWQSPTTLRFHFFTDVSYQEYNRSIDITEMRFVNNTNNLLLPENLVSLKAFQKQNAIEVDWRTTSEVNVDRYVVQKSLDGNQFTDEGVVYAKNLLIDNYSFIDNNPYQGNNYYRIKTFDISGSSKYSYSVNVKLTNSTGDIRVYPNPVTDGNLTVQLTNVNAGIYNGTIFNNIGQKVYSFTINHPGGTASQTFPFGSKFAPGVYEMSVTGNGLTFSQQIVK